MEVCFESNCSFQSKFSTFILGNEGPLGVACAKLAVISVTNEGFELLLSVFYDMKD